METEIFVYWNVHPFEQNGKYGFINCLTFETVIPVKYEKVQLKGKRLSYYYKVQLNGKWGIVSRQGEEIVPPKYDSISDVGPDDNRIVRLNGRYGFLNEYGREFIPPQYELAYNFVFVHDQWRAAVQQNSKWGFINLEGKTIIACRYEAVKSFAPSLIPGKGLAAVQLSSKWGFIDIHGNLVISCDYTGVRSFLNCMAAVKKFGKWGYVDMNGRQVVPLIYDLAGDFDFHTERAKVVSGKKMFFIRKNGERDDAAFDDEFSRNRDGDILRVKTGDKYGYVNKSGDVVIPFIYDEMSQITYNENIIVTLNSKKQFLSKDGTARTPLIYDDIRIPEYGGSYFAVKNNGKWGYVNDEGKQVIPCRYDDASDLESIAEVICEGRLQFIDSSGNSVPDGFLDLKFSEGLAVVGINGRYGYVDETGKVVIPFIYKEASFRFGNMDQMHFHRGLARVKSADTCKIGCIDKTGKTVVPFISDKKIDYSVEDDWMITYWRLDDNDFGQEDWRPVLYNIRDKKIVPKGWKIISDFVEGLAVVRDTNGNTGYIDKMGEVVIPLIFNDARSFIDGLAAVSENGCTWGFVDKTGKMVIPCRYCWEYCHQGCDGFDEYGLKLVGGCSYTDGKWGWIDRTGKTVIPFIYEYAEDFRYGKARVRENYETEAHYIDKNGKQIGK
jgi:hypothetical protein